MSNEYTPDIDLMRSYWIDVNSFEDDPDEAGKEFDRAIAKIKADAWEEGHQAGWEERENPGPFVNDYWDSKLPNPYKEGQA